MLRPGTALMVWLVLLACIACEQPAVIEDSAAACANGIDDDRDGQTDCVDNDCATSGACEQSAATCSNGIDEDRDGAVDCQDSSCVAGDFCQPFTADCSALTQSGCPAGMACYPGDPQSEVCALPGSNIESMPCTAAVDCAPKHSCAGDLAEDQVMCHRLCLHDGHCPREAVCLEVGGSDYGICGVPCAPIPVRPECPGDWKCVSGHQQGMPFDVLLDPGLAIGGSATWHCLPFGASTFEGTANLGDPCDEIPSATALERVCPSSFACAPDAMGDFVCRTVCALSPTDGAVYYGCGQDEDCVPFYPQDPRPFGPIATEVLGSCQPR